MPPYGLARRVRRCGNYQPQNIEMPCYDLPLRYGEICRPLRRRADRVGIYQNLAAFKANGHPTPVIHVSREYEESCRELAPLVAIHRG